MLMLLLMILKLLVVSVWRCVFFDDFPRVFVMLWVKVAPDKIDTRNLTRDLNVCASKPHRRPTTLNPSFSYACSYRTL